MSSRQNSPKNYRLGSAEFVSAPGLVAWAINGAKFERDRDVITNVIAQTWGIPEDAALALVTEAVPHRVEDGTVIFSHGGA